MNFLRKFFSGSGQTKAAMVTPLTVAEDAIERAEAELKTSLPTSFRKLLRTPPPLPADLCARLYWVGEDNETMDDIVAANRQEHEEAGSPLPAFLIAFAHDGMGNQICFDTRHMAADGEYPVVFWDHELESEENLKLSEQPAKNRESAGMISPSFAAWLKAETGLIV